MFRLFLLVMSIIFNVVTLKLLLDIMFPIANIYILFNYHAVKLNKEKTYLINPDNLRKWSPSIVCHK